MLLSYSLCYLLIAIVTVMKIGFYRSQLYDSHTALLRSDNIILPVQIEQQMKDLWATESLLIDSLVGDPCPKLPKTTVLSKIRWVTLGAIPLAFANSFIFFSLQSDITTRILLRRNFSSSD